VTNQTTGDQLCANFVGTICTKCAFGAFFNSLGVCQLVSSSCKTSDQITGACLTCFDGYQLQNNTCANASAQI
jgi:hypothetical protein